MITTDWSYRYKKEKKIHKEIEERKTYIENLYTTGQYTLKEIGEIRGISAERVRQILDT